MANNMKDSEKKPRIRFNEFEGDWESYKLGEISKEITRNDPNSLAPIMMITANNGFIKQSERYAYNNAGESLNKYILLQKGELAYNHGASKLRPYGSCFALTTVDEARIPFVYHCFSAFPNNPEFVSEELNGKDVENQLRKIVSSGARMDGLLNISFEEYKTLSIFIPDTDEQRDIAEFIHQLEDFINLQQKKYTQLLNMKQTLLEKMFPHDGAKVPEIRFDGFEDDWVSCRLEEIVKQHNAGIYISKKNYGEGINIIGVGDIYDSDTIDGEIYRLAPVNDKRFILDENDLIYGESSLVPEGIARTMCVTEKGAGTAFAWHTRRFKIDNSILNSHFLTLELNYNRQVRNYLMNVSTQTALTGMTTDAYFGASIIFPTLKEQERISKTFLELDNLISLQQRKIDQLKNIKHSFLDKMFVS